MRKIISFMHISLDGLVAGSNGEMDWIHMDEETSDFIDERISNSDTALYGRLTYQMMESYWLFVNPIILGHGVPLFEGIDEKVKLKLIPLTRQFSSGVTELNYAVDRNHQ